MVTIGVLALQGDFAEHLAVGLHGLGALKTADFATALALLWSQLVSNAGRAETEAMTRRLKLSNPQIKSILWMLGQEPQIVAADKIDWPVILFAGAAIFLAALIATLGNYLYAWVFTSTFVFAFAALMTVCLLAVLMISKEWKFQSIGTDLDPQLITALLLIFEAVLILTAVAVACSTRLGQVMTLVICTLVFMLGLVIHYFNMQADKMLGDLEGSPLHQGFFWTLKLFFLMVPNLQYLWQADALTQGHSISAQHVILLSGYSVCYIAAILSLAIALFQTREVG